MPIGTRLKTFLAPNNKLLVIAELERLTTVVRFLELPAQDVTQEPYNTRIFFELMQQSWSLLDQVCCVFGNDSDLAEKLCRLRKHALRKCGAEVYAPLLEPLINQL